MRALFILCLLASSVTLSAQQRLTLLFVGDLMQHQAQIDAARTPQGTYDYSACFSLVSPQIQAADLAVGNLEVTLGGVPYSGYPAFSAPDEYLSAIRDAGFDVLLTANNHCLDRGRRGLERTLGLLDSLRISSAGTYRDSTDRHRRYPLFLQKNGFRIALLNYTYGTNGLRPAVPNRVNYIDRGEMLRDIRTAQAWQPDILIACLHWGNEYQSLPSREQQGLADWLFAHGVDHIVGSHPHVLQPMEVRTDSLSGEKHLLAYSLGNFISNMSARNTDGGLVLTLEFEKHPPAGGYGIHNQTVLIRCEYNLVWTGHPQCTGLKNFILYPSDYPQDSLLPDARNRLKIFLESSRKLLQVHNKQVYEKMSRRKK